MINKLAGYMPKNSENVRPKFPEPKVFKLRVLSEQESKTKNYTLRTFPMKYWKAANPDTREAWP